MICFTTHHQPGTQHITAPVTLAERARIFQVDLNGEGNPAPIAVQLERLSSYDIPSSTQQTLATGAVDYQFRFVHASTHHSLGNAQMNTQLEPAVPLTAAEIDAWNFVFLPNPAQVHDAICRQESVLRGPQRDAMCVCALRFYIDAETLATVPITTPAGQI